MRMFRELADVIRADHNRRGISHDLIDQVILLDKEWKDLRYEVDQIRRQRNEAAREIAAAKKAGDSEEVEKILSQVANLGAQIEELGTIADETEKKRDLIRMKIPNILHESVPIGHNDEGNTPHSIHGNMPEFKFQPRVHNDLIEEKVLPENGVQSLNDQSVLLGISWKPTPGGVFKRFHVFDVWLVDQVEYGKFGRAKVTVTLFGGMDKSLCFSVISSTKSCNFFIFLKFFN